MALSTPKSGSPFAAGTAATGSMDASRNSASSATAPEHSGAASASPPRGLLNNRPSWRTSNKGNMSSNLSGASSRPSIDHTMAKDRQPSSSAQTSASKASPHSLSMVSGEALMLLNTPVDRAPSRPSIPSDDAPAEQVARRTSWAAEKCHLAIGLLEREGRLKFLSDPKVPVPETLEPPLICRAMMMSIPDRILPLFRMVLQVLTESGMAPETAVEGINKYLCSSKPDWRGRQTTVPVTTPALADQASNAATAQAPQGTIAATTAASASSLQAPPPPLSDTFSSTSDSAQTNSSVSSTPLLNATQSALSRRHSDGHSATATHEAQPSSARSQQQAAASTSPPSSSTAQFGLNSLNVRPDHRNLNQTQANTGNENSKTSQVASQRVAQQHLSPPIPRSRFFTQTPADSQARQLHVESQRRVHVQSQAHKDGGLEHQILQQQNEQQQRQRKQQRLDQQQQVLHAAADHHANQQQQQHQVSNMFREDNSASTAIPIHSATNSLAASGSQSLPAKIGQRRPSGSTLTAVSTPSAGNGAAEQRDTHNVMDIVNEGRQGIENLLGQVLVTHRQFSDRLHEVYRNDLQNVARTAAATSKASRDERDLASQALQATQKQVEALAKEGSELRADVLDITQKYDAIRVVNDRLTKGLDVAIGEKKRVNEEIAAMREDNQNLAQTITNLMQTVQELRDSQVDSEGLAQTIKHVRVTNAELTARVCEQNDEIKKMTAELAKLKTTLLVTSGRYETGDIELTRLRGLLATAKNAQVADVNSRPSEYEKKFRIAQCGSEKDGEAAKAKREQEKEAEDAELAQVKEQLQTALDTIAVEKESTEELLEELSQNFTQREVAVQSEKDALSAEIKRLQEEIKAKDRAVADQAAKVSALEKDLAELRAQMEAEAAVDAAITVAVSDHLLSSPTIAQDPVAPSQPPIIDFQASFTQNVSVPSISAEAVPTRNKSAASLSRKRTASAAAAESQTKPKKPRMTIGIDNIPGRSESVARGRKISSAAENMIEQQQAELARWALKNLDAGFSLEFKLCKICYTLEKRETDARNQQILNHGGTEADLEPKADISQLTPFPPDSTDEQLAEHLVTEHLPIIAQLKERKQNRLKK